MYNTRRLLIKHEKSRHRPTYDRLYKCSRPGCELVEFTDRDRQLEHLATHDEPGRNEFWNRQFRFFYSKIEPWEIRGEVCPLCQHVIEPGWLMLGRHLGRHMEEISFAVIPRPYEEWKFYDDTASGFSAGTMVTNAMRSSRPAMPR